MEYPYVWEPGEEFAQFSTVGHNEKYYTCIIGHVSSNSTEPGVGTNWKTYWVLSSFNYLPKYNQGQDFFFPFFILPVSAPPVVLSIDPISGPSLGDTNVSVIGQNFTVGSVVFFGTDLAMDIVTINPGLIQCKTPAHNFPVGGVVDVTVINSGGSGLLHNVFTYTPVIPTVISIDPETGFTCVEKAVTITGTNFTVGDQVFFGDTLAEDIVVVNSTTITCVTPPHAVGTVDVSVTNGTYTGTLVGGFTYTSPAPVISYTTQAMSCNGTQNLSASGGSGGPYTWHLSSGGGSLNPSTGSSTVYTAPSSNPNCVNNPEIYVTDVCGVSSAHLKIAVNCYNTTTCAYATCTQMGPNRCTKCWTCDGSLQLTSGTGGCGCAGPDICWTSPNSQCGCSSLECCAYQGGNCLYSIKDNRSTELKNGGCCPVALL